MYRTRYKEQPSDIYSSIEKVDGLSVKTELNLFRLEVFVAVVDTGGFSAAAAYLGISQPSVSYHVKVLEEAIDAPVVVYRNREIHLTPEGRELYDTSRSMLKDVDRLAQAIDGLRTGSRGSLAVGASIAFEHGFFFDLVIAPFVDGHEDVHVSLTFGHSTHLTELVGSGDLDIAYVNDWSLPPETKYEPLHNSNLVFWAAPDHELANADEVQPDQIAEAGLLIAPTREAEWQAFYGLLRQAGVRDPRVPVEIDGVQARKLATEAGLGIFGTFLPPYAGKDAMAPLVPLSLTTETPTIEFGLVLRGDRPPTPVMTDFAEWLRQKVG